LGIKVYKSKLGIFLSQRKYVLDLLADRTKWLFSGISKSGSHKQRTISEIGGKPHLPFTYTLWYRTCSQYSQPIHAQPKWSTHGGSIAST
jgi:hypothetical protein